MFIIIYLDDVGTGSFFLNSNKTYIMLFGLVNISNNYNSYVGFQPYFYLYSYFLEKNNHFFKYFCRFSEHTRVVLVVILSSFDLNS